MHFTTLTGAALALTASLASASPISKRQTSLDPTKPFHINAFSVPVNGSNEIMTYTLTSFYSDINYPKQLQLRTVDSNYDEIANFTLNQSQLILYAAPICQDPAGACATSVGFGDLYPNDNDVLTFQAGPSSPTTGGFAIDNEGKVLLPENTNDVQFSLCPRDENTVVTYEATGSDCTPVTLVAQYNEK